MVKKATVIIQARNDDDKDQRDSTSSDKESNYEYFKDRQQHFLGWERKKKVTVTFRFWAEPSRML